MIKLRKYFRGHNSIYVHGTAKGKDVTLHSTLDKSEWVSEDIVLPKPVSLYRYKWYNIHTNEDLAVTFNLSEIEKDGTVRYGDWFNACTINSRDCIKDPRSRNETVAGTFFLSGSGRYGILARRRQGELRMVTVPDRRLQYGTVPEGNR